ncbi:MAG: hypothetical protein ACWGNK_07675 [Desulfobacterales bacterium]
MTSLWFLVTYTRIRIPGEIYEIIIIVIPWAPTAFSGSVKMVDNVRVEMLGASLGDVSRVLSLRGMGTRDLISKSGTAGTKMP